jgi:thiamine kinase-like enzyme
MSVLTLLPGEDLITWGYRASSQERKALEPYVLAAIVQLQQLTTSLSHCAIAVELPRRTLQGELQSIANQGGPWYDEPTYAEAVERLIPLIERVQTPLVFSNGDYNPANFMFDGQKLTGFVDFAWACFEDPLFGIARYMTYDWLPYDAVALTKRYAATHNFSTSDLDLRVAVACLWRLQELPYADEAIQDTSTFVLRVLRGVLDRLDR